MDSNRRIVPVITEHIEIVDGVRGPKARIAGHNVRVIDIVMRHDRLGMTPSEIVDAIPTITLADVYAALAYFWDHREEIEQRIAEDDELDAEMKRTYPGRLPALLEGPRPGEPSIPA